MLIDGIFASEAIDSSGEILDVEGADITDFEDGKGVLNFEHRGDDAPGASPNDIVGRIVYAKKIHKETDCTTDRERKYWKQIDLPFIYGIIRLHDGAGHPGAIAAAAHFRDYAANKEEALGRFSIEGSTLARGDGSESNRLTHTVCRRVAYTFKPCNKSADSGMMIDPNAPAGFDKKMATKETDKLARLSEISKKERQHPGYTTIGQGPEFTKHDILSADDLTKTTVAGSYNAAPGSLSGGAALQVEDAGLRKRKMINMAKAAVRDWDGRGSFKPFLKNRLPDADPTFVDKFADMVDDYKLKKKEPQVDEENPEEPKNTGPLTIRNKPVRPTPTVDKAFFDEKAGVLRTPRGSVPMYIPGLDPQPGAAQAFHNAMNDPGTTKIHDFALKNWNRVRKMLKAGKLPDAVLMHATLFSQLSPNTPVPTQELMYGHLVDTMKQTGIDARDPRFPTIKENWTDRDSPSEWPMTGGGHYKRLENQLRIKHDSKLTGRKAGEIGGFMLANNKFDNMSGYHKLHGKLAALVAKHKDNAQSGVKELMEHKAKGKLWEAQRERAKDKGQPDIGDYDGPVVRGLAPKTARYMYGMLGGGNVTVPDTHFVRHLFGLQKGKQGDGATHAYIRSLLWNPNNSHIMEGIDRYYSANHDAVNHIVQHPIAQGFDGSRADLTFPAFWKHWMSIVPHEAARGMATFGNNEFTDHKPFWDTIAAYVSKRKEPVAKNDQEAYSKAQDSVKEHMHWQETLGDLPALMMYYAFLVPDLLGPDTDEGIEAPEVALEVGKLLNGTANPNGEVQDVMKFEAFSIALSQKLEIFRKAEEAQKPQVANVTPIPIVHEFQGKKVVPGHIRAWAENASVPGGIEDHAVLGHDAKHFYTVPGHPKQLRGWKPEDVRRINKAGLDRSYNVVRWPEYQDSGHVVDAKVHGDPVFNQSSAQEKLIHGLDMGQGDLNKPEGVFRGISDPLGNHWRKHPAGPDLFLKYEGYVGQDISSPKNEAAYHNLARDVFGLGDYVPPVAVFNHPRTGAQISAIEKVKGNHFAKDKTHHTLLNEMHDSGDLHKLGIMDLLLGHSDRHDGNYLMTPEGKAKMALIDNSSAMPASNSDQWYAPDYLRRYQQMNDMDPKNIPLHDNAQDWVMKLDPKKLAGSLQAMSYPAKTVKTLMDRLTFLKQTVQDTRNAGRQLTIKDLFDPPEQ